MSVTSVRSLRRSPGRGAMLVPVSTPTFRVFVSSTFSDLIAERNLLRARVWPALRERCRARGARFQDVDLRWGVSEEAGLDQRTMDLCLGEVERCRDVSPRPNFLILLGARYGWRPLPPHIPHAEFRAIADRVGAAKTAHLERWYVLDENAVPPLWDLRPRGQVRGPRHVGRRRRHAAGHPRRQRAPGDHQGRAPQVRGLGDAPGDRPGCPRPRGCPRARFLLHPPDHGSARGRDSGTVPRPRRRRGRGTGRPQVRAGDAPARPRRPLPGDVDGCRRRARRPRRLLRPRGGGAVGRHRATTRSAAARPAPDRDRGPRDLRREASQGLRRSGRRTGRDRGLCRRAPTTPPSPSSVRPAPGSRRSWPGPPPRRRRPTQRRWSSSASSAPPRRRPTHVRLSASCAPRSPTSTSRPPGPRPRRGTSWWPSSPAASRWPRRGPRSCCSSTPSTSWRRTTTPSTCRGCRRDFPRTSGSWCRPSPAARRPTPSTSGAGPRSLSPR